MCVLPGRHVRPSFCARLAGGVLLAPSIRRFTRTAISRVRDGAPSGRAGFGGVGIARMMAGRESAHPSFLSWAVALAAFFVRLADRDPGVRKGAVVLRRPAPD